MAFEEKENMDTLKYPFSVIGVFFCVFDKKNKSVNIITKGNVKNSWNYMSENLKYKTKIHLSAMLQMSLSLILNSLHHSTTMRERHKQFFMPVFFKHVSIHTYNFNEGIRILRL